METNKTTLNQDIENLGEALKNSVCIMVSKYRSPIIAQSDNCRKIPFSC